MPKKSRRLRKKSDAPKEVEADAVGGAADLQQQALSDSGAGSGAGEGFQGVPARIRIPGGASYFEYRQALVEPKAPMPLRLFLVNLGWFAVFPAAAVVAALLALYQQRKRLPKYFGVEKLGAIFARE
jgi:hypothetical protein